MPAGTCAQAGIAYSQRDYIANKSSSATRIIAGKLQGGTVSGPVRYRHDAEKRTELSFKGA